jgi:uncharacterized membrane protein
MHIDAVIAHIQTASTTHLYATVIAVSLAFSFFLINSGGRSSALEIMNCDDGSESLKKHTPRKQRRPASAPEPKWHILKMTNYLVTTGFMLSVLQFASNASTYLNDSTSLFQFLSIWSISLCYFFGFFGISFIELDDFVDQPPSQQHQQPVVSQVAQPRKSHLRLVCVVFSAVSVLSVIWCLTHEIMYSPFLARSLR